MRTPVPPWASAAPTAVDTVPSMPEAPRLARTSGGSAHGSARSRSRTALDDPATSSPVAGTAPATSRATARPVSGSASSTPRWPQRADRVGLAPPGQPGTVADAGHLRRPRVVAQREQLDVVAGEQLGDRPRQRGPAGHHHPLDVAAEVLEQQPVGADRVRPAARPGARLGEQRPAAASASPRASARAWSPATTTVRPPAASGEVAPRLATAGDHTRELRLGSGDSGSDQRRSDRPAPAARGTRR